MRHPPHKLHKLLVHTGYLQAFNGTRASFPNSIWRERLAASGAVTLSLRPNFNASNDTAMTFPFDHSPAHASFHAAITVPRAAQLVQYTLELSVTNSPYDAGRSVADYVPPAAFSEAFRVADPRPPTATLNVTLPPLVRAGCRAGGGGARHLCPCNTCCSSAAAHVQYTPIF